MMLIQTETKFLDKQKTQKSYKMKINREPCHRKTYGKFSIFDFGEIIIILFTFYVVFLLASTFKFTNS